MPQKRYDGRGLGILILALVLIGSPAEAKAYRGGGVSFFACGGRIVLKVILKAAHFRFGSAFFVVFGCRFSLVFSRGRFYLAR